MAASAPSPAPWVDTPLGFGELIRASNGAQIAVAYGEGVNPNAKTDIRVLRYAPQMLESLKEVTRTLKAFASTTQLGASQREGLAKAEAIIMLATGER